MASSVASDEMRMRKAVRQALTRRKTALENVIEGDLALVNMEMAKVELIESFNKLEAPHDSYVAAKDSEIDDPEDLEFMNEPLKIKKEILARWKTWNDSRKIAEEANKTERNIAKLAREKIEAEKNEANRTAREKAARLTLFKACLELDVEAVGDPERDIKETIEVGISNEILKERVKKLEKQLEKLEEMRTELVEEEGADSA